jgi:hypothetical protein
VPLLPLPSSVPACSLALAAAGAGCRKPRNPQGGWRQGPRPLFHRGTQGATTDVGGLVGAQPSICYNLRSHQGRLRQCLSSHCQIFVELGQEAADSCEAEGGAARAGHARAGAPTTVRHSRVSRQWSVACYATSSALFVGRSVDWPHRALAEPDPGVAEDGGSLSVDG